ncbi:hypothetical protein AncyloWKF20_09520 [Ancylobacter sp. WKF20]|uniref:hypothetical protein n=1 Tax=Ancylobacter sp. WKF20 TaxID=3039801 RepID=UPI0024344268|nr:hypothetical protein [Ancylobacter sp. WKF20]WGD32031.1 hypothetical protein AncyloWKF20_09520 [Ancylobacter sp. WKF20]
MADGEQEEDQRQPALDPDIHRLICALADMQARADHERDRALARQEAARSIGKGASFSTYRSCQTQGDMND